MPHKDPNRQAMIEFAGNRMKQMRKELGLTQSEMAELLTFECDTPVDVKTIHLWEKGEVKMPAWAFCHMELLIEERNTRIKLATTQESIMQHKTSLLNAVMKKVRGILKGEV